MKKALTTAFKDAQIAKEVKGKKRVKIQVIGIHKEGRLQNVF